MIFLFVNFIAENTFPNCEYGKVYTMLLGFFKNAPEAGQHRLYAV